MSNVTTEDTSTLARAKAETQRLLALLSEAQPNADEIKDRWYSAGLAIRTAITELRQAETGIVERKESYMALRDAQKQ